MMSMARYIRWVLCACGREFPYGREKECIHCRIEQALKSSGFAMVYTGIFGYAKCQRCGAIYPDEGSIYTGMKCQECGR